MTINRHLQRFLDALGTQDQCSFDRFQRALQQSKYTGYIGMHTFNGKIQQIDIGTPVRLAIVEAADPAAAPVSPPAP